MRVDEGRILRGIARLREKGLPFEHGLSDAEFADIESRLGFEFPPDLRFFLKCALPTSPSFVNWRGDDNHVRARFTQIDGVLFDVENSDFWWEEWGPRPKENPLAIQIARRKLESVPMMIPFARNPFAKCIPERPAEWGNPVFSINQTDVLHAGRDLGDFLDWFSRPSAEFERDEEKGISPTALYGEDYRPIPFWTDLVKRNSVP